MSPITGVVLETFAADVAGEELDVGVRGDVVLQVVASEKALAAKFANVNPSLFTGVMLKSIVVKFKEKLLKIENLQLCSL